MRIRILLDLAVDSDPHFHSDVDPDPSFHLDADPDPASHKGDNDADLETGERRSRKLFFSVFELFICCPSDFTVSEDAEIEPRILATLALTARRSSHLARSHPQIQPDIIHRSSQISSTGG
jgi:hypothetical protein